MAGSFAKAVAGVRRYKSDKTDKRGESKRMVNICGDACVVRGRLVYLVDPLRVGLLWLFIVFVRASFCCPYPKKY